MTSETCSYENNEPEAGLAALSLRTSQQLLHAPWDTQLGRDFLNNAEAHYDTLYARDRIRADREVFGRYHSMLFNVFSYLIAVRIARTCGDMLAAGIPISAAGEIAEPPLKVNYPQSIHTNGPYEGACHTFMTAAEALANAVDELIVDVLYGKDQSYRDVWDMFKYAAAHYATADNSYRKRQNKSVRLLQDRDTDARTILKDSWIANANNRLEDYLAYGIGIVLHDTLGQLPSATEITRILRLPEVADRYMAMASMSREISADLRNGSAYAAARKKGKFPEFPLHIVNALSNYIGNPSGPEKFAGISVESALFAINTPALHTSLEGGPWKRARFCGGQHAFRPREKDRDALEIFFNRVAKLEMPETISAVEVLYHMVIQMSGETVFADDLAREGIMAASEYVRTQRAMNQ